MFVIWIGTGSVDVEGKRDGESDDAHVDGQTQPGEEVAFVGAVVAGVGGDVGEEERGEVRGRAEEGGVVDITGGSSVRTSTPTRD